MTIKINGTNTAANPSITGTDTDTGIVYGSDQIDFSIGGSSKLTLDPSGRLLLGTTTEGQSSADDLTIATTGNTGITIRSGTSNTGNLYFSDGTSSTAEFQGFIEYNHSGSYLRFGTAASERMRLLSGGGLTFNGDTAAANALNDYEEGYWSPTAMDGIPITTNNTGNHPSRRYVKIGKIVFAYFDFTFGNQFNAFGARFGGLPITVAAGGGHGANASTNGYTNLQQEYFLHVSGTNPAIFKSNGAQFTHNEVSSKRFAGCIIYSTD